MELYEAIKNRRSIRKYRPDPVPEDALLRVLDAVRAAPSWKNRQAWHVLVVRERETIQAIGKALGNNPRGVSYETLPAMLLLAMDEAAIESHDGRDYYLVDAGIAGEHIVLAAQAEGLGTCWVGWFEEAPLKALLGVPAAYRLVMVTPLGYPDESPDARPRKPLSDFIHHERW